MVKVSFGKGSAGKYPQPTPYRGAVPENSGTVSVLQKLLLSKEAVGAMVHISLLTSALHVNQKVL